MSSRGKEVPFAFLFLQMFHFLCNPYRDDLEVRPESSSWHGLSAILALAEPTRIDACQAFPGCSE